MKPVADSMGKRYGYGPGKMNDLPGLGVQITEDTRLLKRVFPKDLKVLFWYMIAGEAIFRQKLRHTSFALLICSGN